MTMKPVAVTVASFAFLALAASPVDAAETKPAQGAKMEAGKAAAEPAHKGSGTVNSVDAKAGKVNLSHGPVASLNWPGMKMDFAVQDKQALAGLKPGTKVEFKLMEKSKGQYVITEIAPMK
jgi:Cu/Ag efflux protein CusF